MALALAGPTVPLSRPLRCGPRGVLACPSPAPVRVWVWLIPSHPSTAFPHRCRPTPVVEHGELWPQPDERSVGLATRDRCGEVPVHVAKRVVAAHAREPCVGLWLRPALWRRRCSLLAVLAAATKALAGGCGLRRELPAGVVWAAAGVRDMAYMLACERPSFQFEPPQDMSVILEGTMGAHGCCSSLDEGFVRECL